MNKIFGPLIQKVFDQHIASLSDEAKQPGVDFLLCDFFLFLIDFFFAVISFAIKNRHLRFLPDVLLLVGHYFLNILLGYSIGNAHRCPSLLRRRGHDIVMAVTSSSTLYLRGVAMALPIWVLVH